jgi:hypothetical protein
MGTNPGDHTASGTQADARTAISARFEQMQTKTMVHHTGSHLLLLITSAPANKLVN